MHTHIYLQGIQNDSASKNKHIKTESDKNAPFSEFYLENQIFGHIELEISLWNSIKNGAAWDLWELYRNALRQIQYCTILN